MCIVQNQAKLAVKKSLFVFIHKYIDKLSNAVIATHRMETKSYKQ